MLSSPLVTVIIPNYNHALYLPLRIESVINQTFKDVEIIILDDCSSDNSRQIISSYAVKDSRIRFVYNEQNSGSTFKQWNKGFELVRGKYIWIAESDDSADKNFLAKLLSCFENEPQIVLAYSNSFDIDANDNIKGTIEWSLVELDEMWNDDFTVDGTSLIKRFMPYRNVIPNASAVLFEARVINELGGANEKYRLCGDMAFWAKILSKGKASYLSEPLNYWRSHQNNVRTKTSLDGSMLIEASQVMGAIQIYGELDKDNIDKSFVQLVNLWYDSWANRYMSFSVNKDVYNNILFFYPNSKRRIFALLSKRFFDKNSGLKALIRKSVLFRMLKTDI